MKYSIDVKLLEEQIGLCDTHAINASTEHECDLFEDIANFLDTILFAMDNDEPIEFEVECNGKDEENEEIN